MMAIQLVESVPPYPPSGKCKHCSGTGTRIDHKLTSKPFRKWCPNNHCPYALWKSKHCYVSLDEKVGLIIKLPIGWSQYMGIPKPKGQIPTWQSKKSDQIQADMEASSWGQPSPWAQTGGKKQTSPKKAEQAMDNDISMVPFDLHLRLKKNGSAQLTMKPPQAVAADERYMKLHIDVPLSIFETPTLSATITVHDKGQDVELNVEAMSDALSKASGLTIELDVKSVS